MTTFFLAGIIQGSMSELTMHAQDYRTRLKEILLGHVPDAEVYCPVEHHPNSLDYDDARAREVFLGHVERGASSDVLVAFVPEASMGTAVEMWEAYKRGGIVLTVTPMAANWTVKFLSTRVFADLAAFEAFVTSGELARLIATYRERT